MSLVEIAGLLLIAVALVHGALTLIAVLVWREGARKTAGAQPPVTLLKPLHGDEPLLEAALRSCFEQDYPQFQIVFGVQSPADPSLRIVERLRGEYPGVSVSIVANPTLHGSNRKVSNLINMLPAARHDLLVLADSDIHVGPDYLAALVPPLLDDRVGVVTCLYRGRTLPNRWSRLGALYIADWFMPSVLLARLLGRRNFAFGATLALRRPVLQAIGGLEAVRNHLADDFMLSDLVQRHGLRTVLSPVVVETTVAETSAASLMRHELRWLRTNRFLEPLGYAFCFLTFTLPLTALGFWLADGADAALPLAVAAVSTRVLLHVLQRHRGHQNGWGALWLLPLRDVLTPILWLAAFFSRDVAWGAQRFKVGRDGSFKERGSS